MQKGMIDTSLSEEEFLSKYETYCRERGYEPEKLTKGMAEVLEEVETESTPKKLDGQDLNLDKIVLKFTTLSESGTEAPSFTVTRSGARIGRGSSNEVSVPSDVKLESIEHARIEYVDGCFYLVDKGFIFGAGNSTPYTK